MKRQNEWWSTWVDEVMNRSAEPMPQRRATRTFRRQASEPERAGSEQQKQNEEFKQEETHGMEQSDWEKVDFKLEQKLQQMVPPRPSSPCARPRSGCRT